MSCSFLVLNILHFQLVAHANNVPIARFKSRKLKLLMLQSLPVARIGHGHGCVGKIAEHVMTLEQEGCIADTYEYGPVRWAKSFHFFFLPRTFLPADVRGRARQPVLGGRHAAGSRRGLPAVIR